MNCDFCGDEVVKNFKWKGLLFCKKKCVRDWQERYEKGVQGEGE